MPEGPSIIILKEKISYLKHKIVAEASGYGKIDMGALEHKKIMDFKSWGKHFFICFSDFTIRIHFGLFGSYQFHEPKKVNPKLALHFNDDSVYFYVCTVERLDEPLDQLYDWTADIMNDRFDQKKAMIKLKEQGKKKICDVLLDQHIFSGVGNIIKNEVLYRCQVHPESIVDHIPDDKLTAIIQESTDFSFDFLKWRRNNELKKHLDVYQQKVLSGTDFKVVKKDTGTTRRSSYFVEEEQVLYK